MTHRLTLIGFALVLGGICVDSQNEITIAAWTLGFILSGGGMVGEIGIGLVRWGRGL